MKKLILLLSTLFIGLFAMAQKTPDVFFPIKSNCVINVLGQAGDTVVKNGTLTYRMYVSNFCEKIKVRPILTRTKGNYTKTRVIISGSLNAVNYVNLDTLLFAGSGASQTAESDLITAYYPYIKIIVAPYDSTQTIKALETILIQKD